jgi:hypothetical protein
MRERATADPDRLGQLITAGALAAHTGLTTGAITGVVDRLARAGYVRREPNRRDRRSVIVSRVPSPAVQRLGPGIFAAPGRRPAGS